MGKNNINAARPAIKNVLNNHNIISLKDTLNGSLMHLFLNRSFYKKKYYALSFDKHSSR